MIKDATSGGTPRNQSMNRRKEAILATIRRMWSPIRRRPWLRSLVVALVIIATSEIVLHEAYLHDWMPETATAAADAMLVNHVGFVDEEHPVGITFLDVDDDVWRKWGETVEFPKDRLPDLIEYARHGARAIVIDVAMERALSASPKLADYVAAYGRGGDGKWPPLIAVRSFEPIGDQVRSRIVRGSGSDNFPAPLPITWASPLFQVDNNLVIRKWRLWEAECLQRSDEPMMARVTPSVQLAVLAALQGKTEQLKQKLQIVGDAKCNGKDIDLPPLDLIKNGIDLAARGLGERILYTTSWREPYLTQAVIDGHSAELVNVMKASPVGPGSERLELIDGASTDPIRDRVVIISASAWQARDMHATPIGTMPGAFVLANAISTLTQVGQLRDLDSMPSTVMGIIIGVAVWVLLEFLNFSLAILIYAIVFPFLSLIIARFFLREGYWVDALLPSLGLIIHQWFVILEGIWKKRGLGMRALLSDHYQGHKAIGSKAPHLCAIVLVAFAAWGSRVTRSSAAEVAVAGRILTMPGYPQEYRLTRPGVGAIRPTYSMDLLAGDVVEAIGASPMTLYIPGKPDWEVRPGAPPYVLQPPSVTASYLAPIRELLVWIGYEKRTLRPVPGTSEVLVRAPTRLKTALTGLPDQKVAAGSHALPLGWVGGKPPYKIAVVATDQHELLKVERSEAGRFVTEPLDLARGTYEIVVTDADGTTLSTVFEAVEPSQVPRPSTTELEGFDNLPAATVSAAWLVQRQGSTWQLEAMIEALELSRNYEPASALLECLMRGRVPPKQR